MVRGWGCWRAPMRGQGHAYFKVLAGTSRSPRCSYHHPGVGHKRKREAVRFLKLSAVRHQNVWSDTLLHLYYCGCAQEKNIVESDNQEFGQACSPNMLTSDVLTHASAVSFPTFLGTLHPQVLNMNPSNISKVVFQGLA